ncbi:unnamed protein product [Arctogadus glacialis]
MEVDPHCQANRTGFPLAWRVGLFQTYGGFRRRAECDDALDLVVFPLFRVTLEDGSRGLIHKGNGFGHSSQTVVVDVTHMSSDWKLWISATNVIVGIRQRTRDAGTRATARLLATVFTLLHNQEQDCAPGPRSGSNPDTDLGPPDPDLGPPDPDLGPPQTRTWVHLRPGPGSTSDPDLGPPQTRTWVHLRPGPGSTSDPDLGHPGPRPEEKNRIYLNEPTRTPDSTWT